MCRSIPSSTTSPGAHISGRPIPFHSIPRIREVQGRATAVVCGTLCSHGHGPEECSDARCRVGSRCDSGTIAISLLCIGKALLRMTRLLCVVVPKLTALPCGSRVVYFAPRQVFGIRSGRITRLENTCQEIVLRVGVCSKK